jgi:hypothetical protein
MTESEFIVAARVAELTASRGPLPASLARLPEDLQAALTAIGAAGRGLFGNRNTQSIFDANLPALERLYGCGASHRDVAEILHAIGITRADGEPLSAGTVSSALSRARRAAARKPVRPRGADRSPRRPRLAVRTGTAKGAAAAGGGAQLGTAASSTARPPHAPPVPEQPDPPTHRGNVDDLRSGAAGLSHDSSRTSHTNAGPRSEAPGSSPLPRASPDDGDNTAAARKAGELLNHLRLKNHAEI